MWVIEIEHHQMLLFNLQKQLIESIESFCLLLFRRLYLDKSECIKFQHFTSSQPLQSKSGEIKDMLINLFRSIS
jgi:hypothetical protein